MTTLFYKIPPHFPLPACARLKWPKGVPRLAGFGKWFDETHHPELVEGEGRPACAKPRLCGTKAGGRFSNDHANSILRALIKVKVGKLIRFDAHPEKW